MTEQRLVPMILRSLAAGSWGHPVTALEAARFIRRVERELKLPEVLLDREAADDALFGMLSRARGSLRSDLPLEARLRLVAMLVQFFTEAHELNDFDGYQLFWDTICFEPGELSGVLREALQDLHGDNAAQSAIQLGLERLDAV